MIKTARERQPGRVRKFGLDHTLLTLEERGNVGDDHTVLGAGEHLIHAEPPTAVIQGDDDLIDLQLVCQDGKR